MKAMEIIVVNVA